MPAWLGPAVQGAGSILGSIISNIGQKKAQKRNFAHDRSMAEYAYSKDLEMWNRQSQWNLDMWNLQNQYNAPAAVMDRLTAAGLNPNLVATAGASGGSAASVQPATMPRYQTVRRNVGFNPISVPNILGLYNNFQLAQAQRDNLKSVTELNEQRSITEAIRQHGMGYDNAVKYANAKYSQQMAQLEVDRRTQALINAGIDQQIKRSMVGRTSAEAGLKQMEYEFFRNLGIKGMRDIAPFLQLLLQSFRGR